MKSFNQLEISNGELAENNEDKITYFKKYCRPKFEKRKECKKIVCILQKVEKINGEKSIYVKFYMADDKKFICPFDVSLYIKRRELDNLAKIFKLEIDPKIEERNILSDADYRKLLTIKELVK